MSEILFCLFLFLLFGVRGAQFWRSIQRNRQLARTWQEAAGACGLQVLETSGWTPRLNARSGSLTVMIDELQGCRINVRFPAPPEIDSVIIRRQPLVRRSREIESGDPHFDSTFFLEGPMPSVLALLDAETRHLLTRANAEGTLQIFNSTLRVEGLPDEQVPHVLPLLLQIGRRLAPVDIARRLAANASRDPEAGVRLQNLLALIRDFPGDPRTLEVLRAACSDSSPRIRLQAARQLGAERRDILFELAESLEDDTVSAEAVSALDRELSFERTKAILDQAQDRHLPKTTHACLEALGEKGASPGQLSMDGTDAGQLALASDEAGQLALASEGGRLALAADPASQTSLAPFESGPFEPSSEEPGQPPPREREGPGGRRG